MQLAEVQKVKEVLAPGKSADFFGLGRQRDV